ncbi:MAG TPA: C1 family peptidase [Anaerolineae bacterium]|nr:C1 family peptidase [Anaerolineae bacterium]
MSQDDLSNLQWAIEDQGFSWEAGDTSMSALEPEEQERRLGLTLVPEEMERISFAMAELPFSVAEFPEAWDWRDVEGANWTTAIRDQEGCGSCVAFGTSAVLEAMFKLHEQDAALQPDLSEAHLFFCGCGNCCDKGWWPSYALDYARDSGVPDEACFPYQDRNMPCSDSCDDWQSRVVKVTSWQEVLDVGARKEWLATKGPMVACMAVYQDFFSYRGGVYRHTTGSLAGYHAICAVGYSEAEQCWICKNSWGSNWGDAGWFKIGYGECGIDSQFAMYGVDDVTPPSPEPPPPPPPPPPPQPDGCWEQIKGMLGL